MIDIRFRLTNAEYERFQKFVLKHSGLYFPENRRSELEKGILEALENAPAGITSPDSYYAYLNHSNDSVAQAESERLINLLTVGETHFFRNTAQFDALSTHILPALIAQKREVAALVSKNTEPIPQLRIWSAGCSTGEEPYSLAILLRELIPDIDKWRIFILGTDINADSLARARAATYRDWSFREDDAKLKRQIYFEQQGKQYQLSESVRRHVTFAKHNLIEDDFPSPHNGIVAMDLIICRNVTIYFAPETTQQLIKKFHATLIDGGWLLVGHSEPSVTGYEDFVAYAYPKAILYQKAKQLAPSQNGEGGTNRVRGNTAVLRQTSILEERNATRRLNNVTTRLAASGTGLLRQPSPATSRLRTTSLLREANGEAKKLASQRCEEANSLLLAGKAEAAIQILQTVIAENKNYGPAYCLIAHAYADMGQGLKARSWSQRAIQHDPLNGRAYYILALLDENEGFLAQAIRNLKKMIYIDANNPLPHFHLAVLYSKAEQKMLAERSLQNAIRILRFLPKDKILPESGERAGWLLQTAQKMLTEKPK